MALKKKVLILSTFVVTCLSLLLIISVNPNVLLPLTLVTLIWGVSSGLVLIISKEGCILFNTEFLQIALELALLAFCLGCFFYSGFITLNVVVILVGMLCGISFGIGTASVLIMLNNTY